MRTGLGKPYPFARRRTNKVAIVMSVYRKKQSLLFQESNKANQCQRHLAPKSIPLELFLVILDRKTTSLRIMSISEPLIGPEPDAARNTVTSSRNETSRGGRLLDRDAAFCQSRGRWSVEHVSREEARQLYLPEGGRRSLSYSKRIWDDWFYTLAYKKTLVLILILFLTYLSIVIFFAAVYLLISRIGQSEKVNPDGTTSVVAFCDMDIHDRMEALFFSLSTMTTIGYGVSDYYFGGCITPFVLVLMQVCCAIVFDAVAIGLIFQRLSRGQKRSKSVVLSDKALVQCIDHKLYLMFRVCELRRHQLLEAKARAYCVRHERHMTAGNLQTTPYVTRPMKLSQELVLMSLPQVICHKIGPGSPLYPPSSWYDRDGTLHETFGEAVKDDIDLFWKDRQVEVIILIEGSDELTGASIQARHSYVCGEIVWNCAFENCIKPFIDGGRTRPGMFRRRQSPQTTCQIDFANFHSIYPVEANLSSSPYVDHESMEN